MVIFNEFFPLGKLALRGWCVLEQKQAINDQDNPAGEGAPPGGWDSHKVDVSQHAELVLL